LAAGEIIGPLLEERTMFLEPLEPLVCGLDLPALDDMSQRFFKEVTRIIGLSPGPIPKG
jgi:hypothetical protein